QIIAVGRSHSDAITGKIGVIGRRVDPATRLVSVMVAPPPATQLMLETFVMAKIVKEAGEGLIVPREALLPQEDGGSALFTVNSGHARKHAVRIAIQNERDAQVI